MSWGLPPVPRPRRAVAKAQSAAAGCWYEPSHSLTEKGEQRELERSFLYMCLFLLGWARVYQAIPVQPICSAHGDRRLGAAA